MATVARISKQQKCYDTIIAILALYLQRPVSYTNLVYFSFNHKRKSRLKCALWFSIKVMFSIFYGKCFNKSQLLNDILKEVDWNLRLNRYVGSLADILDLRSIFSNWWSMVIWVLLDS